MFLLWLFVNTVINLWVPCNAATEKLYGLDITALGCKYRGGRAMAQAVSHRFPTATGRIRARVRSGGIRSEQSDTGVGFLRVLRFPLPILIPPTTPHSSSSIIRGSYNTPITGRCAKWTVSPHPQQTKTKGQGRGL
jgi:hypothetical protein